MRAHDQSRRSFLGQLGVTAAAGLGLALVPSIAQAAPGGRTRQQGEGRPGTAAIAYHCCKNPGYCGTCTGGRFRYKCVAVEPSCSPNVYCTSCGGDRGTCYDQIGC